jgi:uncharacterized protein YjbJ (UPF0337 family)
MSIATDIRTYADTAVTQGKRVLDQAQAQLTDVTGQATELYGKARGNVAELAGKATTAAGDLRASAEKAVNLDALKTAVEPYVAQVKGYTHQVTDRAEALLGGVKGDARVAKLVDTAGVVVGTVQERVLTPVLSFTGRGPAPVSRPAAPATATAAPKPAVTKPAAKAAAAEAPATASSATKPAATKPAAPRKTAAKRPTTS